MARLVVVALLAVAAPAFAADGSGKPAKSDDDRVVCKTIETTGSLISRGRDCRKASEWRAIEDESSRSAKGLMDTLSGQRANIGGSAMGSSSGIPTN